MSDQIVRIVMRHTTYGLHPEALALPVKDQVDALHDQIRFGGLIQVEDDRDGNPRYLNVAHIIEVRVQDQ